MTNRADYEAEPLDERSDGPVEARGLQRSSQSLRVRVYRMYALTVTAPKNVKSTKFIYLTAQNIRALVKALVFAYIDGLVDYAP